MEFNRFFLHLRFLYYRQDGAYLAILTRKSAGFSGCWYHSQSYFAQQLLCNQRSDLCW